MTTDTLPAILTVKQTATYLQLAPSTVYDLIKTGRLKATRTGPQSIRIRLADVDQFIKGNPAFGGSEHAQES